MVSGAEAGTIVQQRNSGAANIAGKDIENGGAEAGEKEADVPKADKAKAGAAPVKTDNGEQEVDFKTLTADEAFQVLGVSLPSLLPLHYPPPDSWRFHRSADTPAAHIG